MEDVITLCKNEPTFNNYQIQVDNYTEREVFCDIRSASRSEFYQAQAVGIRPEFECDVSAIDYEGEQVAKFHDEMYRIIRTYRSPRDYRTNMNYTDSDKITLTLARGLEG